jgi:CubicO group peptidase (beta-lactamase class C family)
MHDPIAAAVGAIVDAGKLAGAATLVWRDGAVVQQACLGWRDVEHRQPIERDTLFRIASMTKPVTSVAALMLHEEGRFALDEPVTAWAPELAAMRVLRSPDGPIDDTVPAARPITFGDLLTHRSGLTYGDLQTGPLAAAYQDALGGTVDSTVTPDEWIAGVATLPLLDQPGTAYHYGVSTDLLGLLLARIDGAPLGEVLRRRIFAPLGMTSTGFTVPPSERDRRAGIYGFDAAGALTRLDAIGRAAVAERPDELTFVSGGAGLWSTVDDYLAFARLFVEDGTVDGATLLRPETLRLMTANQLTPDQRATARQLGRPIFAKGHSFAMGLAVVLEPEHADPLHGAGGVGTVSWPGAWGGWWQADPTDRSVMVFLAHSMADLDQLSAGIGLDVFLAIVEFQSLAAAMR